MVLSTFTLTGGPVVTYHCADVAVAGDTAAVVTVDGASVLSAIEARARASHHGRSAAKWGISLYDGMGRRTDIVIAPYRDGSDDVTARDGVRLTVESGVALVDTIVYEGVDGRSDGANSLRVDFGGDGSAVVSLGNRALSPAATISLASPMRWCVTATDAIHLDYSLSETAADPIAALATAWTVDDLAARFATSADPLEGFWDYLDRETDERVMKLGGYYTVAIMAVSPGCYDIIYVDGARVNSHKWTVGMRKGTLEKTIFSNHYNLTWVDSTFGLMDEETSADVEQGTIMSLNFPIYGSSIRLVRRPR